MLGDPWQELRQEMGWGQEASGRKQKAGSMSEEGGNKRQEEADSRKPGEAVSQPPGESRKPVAPFYRTGGDGEVERREWERSRLMGEEDEEEGDSYLLGEESVLEQEEAPEEQEGEGVYQEKSLSDSLIPQVGDSLCERNHELDKQEEASS